MKKLSEQNLRQVLQNGINDKVTPILAASIGSPANNWTMCLGCDEKTPFDLASLTKILSTTLLAAIAIDEKKLTLTETPWLQWPGVSVAHILNHTSGLPAWLPLYDSIAKPIWGTPAAKAQIIAAVLQTKTDAAPGAKTVYSDLGFIALGDLLEKRLGQTLTKAFQDAAKKYFGETTFHFEAPVNDQTCDAMGELVGHAGLFGSLLDINKGAQFFLRCLQNKEPGVPQIIREFIAYPGERALGFDRPTSDGATGNALSSGSVGHLGYTGTSLWLDPQLDAYFVLLTNRVAMGPDKDKIKNLRQRFHQGASELIRSWLLLQP